MTAPPGGGPADARVAPRPQLLFISPVMPDRTGSGNPMRASVFLEALSPKFDIHLLVVTFAGSASADSVPQSVRAHTVRVVVHQALAHGAGAAVARWRTGATPRQAVADEFLAFARVARAWPQLQERPHLARFATEEVVAAALAAFGDQAFDLVHVMHLYMAPFAERFLAATGTARPCCVLDLDDDESEKRLRLSALFALNGDRASASHHAAEARRFAAMEIAFLARFDRVLVCSARDRAAIATRHRLDTVEMAPNAIRLPVAQTNQTSEPRWSFLFIGALGYFPNVDAVRFFCLDVLPRVRAQGHAAASVAIAGGLASAQVATELSRVPGVTLLGRVADPSTCYRSAVIAVAPIRAAGGTRIKLLEAFAHGTPAVSTTMGAEGLEAIDGRHLLVADGADGFAAACVRLLDDPELRARLAGEAAAFVRTRYQLSVVVGTIQQVFERAGRSSST
jgi:glycosyltransferase involved in cell wall biosynthesis